MKSGFAALWIAASTVFGACSDSLYQPDPAALVGEFSGRAGTDFKTYDLFLAVDEVTDSVRGVWSLSYVTTCFTHDGAFSGSLSGDHLRLRLRPDEPHESTFEVSLRVLPGDSVISGQVALVILGEGPQCFSDHAPITLHQGEVNGLPLGR